MSTPHIHAPIIKAWADGAKIEYREADSSHWYPIEHPSWNANMLYRVAKRTIKFRLYLWKPGAFLPTPRPPIVSVVTEEEWKQDPREKWIGFVKWVSDWQTVELP